jgi:HAD superfamily hydrolase (TIGR01549 family)
VLRGVLFDLDDTLLDTTGADRRIWLEIVEVIAARLPAVDRRALRERYLAVTDLHYAELAAGRVDLHTFRRRRLADALSPWGELDEELFEQYTALKDRLPEEVTAFPEAVGVLRGLRRHEIRVGLLTNGPSAFQRRKLAVTGLEDELDSIAISGEIGSAKPEESAFATALGLLGTDAGETAMVGDSLAADIAGGLGAGLATVVWVSAEGVPPEGVHRVETVAQLPTLLGLG